MTKDNSLQLLCVSKNGIDVYYDAVSSHAATHFDDTENLKELVKTILIDTVLKEDKEYFVHDFHEVVGKTDLIRTVPGDSIIYAKRLNRDGYTRFILNKSPADSSKVTLILYKNDASYTLYSAWVGEIVPSFPDTATATSESIPFWKEHALIWGTQKIQPGTETSEWPWG